MSSEYLQSKRLLGGLLLLLPENFRRHAEAESELSGSESEDGHYMESNRMALLEQWLVHNSFPVRVGNIGKS